LAVVDNEFKVRGVKALRVVDHAVEPLMANNHTQCTCYLIPSQKLQVWASRLIDISRENLLQRKSLRNISYSLSCVEHVYF